MMKAGMDSINNGLSAVKKLDHWVNKLKNLVDTLVGTFFYQIITKLSQNVCLCEILDEFETGSSGVINFFTETKILTKYHIDRIKNMASRVLTRFF